MLQNVRMTLRPNPPLAALLACGALCATTAHASLGGDATSVLVDARALHGTVRLSQALLPVQVQEIMTDNGMRVREFLSRDGIVFAVAWQGPAMPDLQRLLAAQFAGYASAVAALERPGLHRSLRIVISGLVVESDAHLRGYNGRAYLPAMIPVDVSIAELR